MSYRYDIGLVSSFYDLQHRQTRMKSGGRTIPRPVPLGRAGESQAGCGDSPFRLRSGRTADGPARPQGGRPRRVGSGRPARRGTHIAVSGPADLPGGAPAQPRNASGVGNTCLGARDGLTGRDAAGWRRDRVGLRVPHQLAWGSLFSGGGARWQNARPLGSTRCVAERMILPVGSGVAVSRAGQSRAEEGRDDEDGPRTPSAGEPGLLWSRDGGRL